MAKAIEEIDKVLTRFWENQQLLRQSAVNPDDVCADAAMVVEMAREADIPLEEIVASEKDRKILVDFAEQAEPYGGTAERL